MFSVGIIGSVTSKALVKLIDFEIPVTSGNCAFYLARDGRCYYRNNAGQDTYIPGIWYTATDTETPGSSYDVRFTLEAGTATGTFGTWLALSSFGGRSVSFSVSQSGRVLVEIRDTATQTTRAAKRVWRGAFAP